MSECTHGMLTLKNAKWRCAECNAIVETEEYSCPNCETCHETLEDAENCCKCQNCEKLETLLKHIRTITDCQAEDEGLWFVATTAPEAYLQQELRKLHSAIEALLPEQSDEQ